MVFGYTNQGYHAVIRTGFNIPEYWNIYQISFYDDAALTNLSGIYDILRQSPGCGTIPSIGESMRSTPRLLNESNETNRMV
jgi:hypothetical protein